MVALALLFACDAGDEPEVRDSGAPADSGDTGETGLAGDADGDGHVDAALGGDDCDDADAWTYAGAEEWCDQVDHDCDGEALDERVCAKAQVVEAVGGAMLGAATDDRVADSWLWSDLDADGDAEWVVSVIVPDAVNPNGWPILGMIDPIPDGGSALALDHMARTLEWDGSGSAHSLLPVPDFDGDGVGDLVIVGYGYLWSDTGAHVLLGPSSAWPEQLYVPRDADAHWMRWDDDDVFGYTADAGGDVDGDGLSDIVLTTPGNAEASAVLIPGRTDPTDGSARDETLLTADVGQGVAFVGDQDGDGLDDLVFDEYGLAWVSGADVDLGGIGDWGAVLFDVYAEDRCGSALTGSVRAEIGDWTGDGRDDVAFTCKDAGAGSDDGVLHLLDGAALATADPGAWPGDLSVGSWVLSAEEALWTTALDVTGDLDGDGVEDLLLMQLFDDEPYERGYVPLLSSDGPPAPYTDPTTRGFALEAVLGGADGSVLIDVGIGDADGDGWNDLAITTRSYTDATVAEAWLIYGWDLPWHDAAYW